ncbi:unnamed protein product [Notodromas monacha]|uniref:Uncharacterized protein n=1 Tax=Notodromas monacha TaxID=399045 RepID=A0A7R9GC44_9CRUS|nr:unnamed protein product [Notodromas monacha]CAG0917089.1 unnamed protein product [Notodromas monacha]
MGDHITESNVFSILEKICENEGSLKISESVLIGISKALADLKQIWAKLGLSQDEQAEKLAEFSQRILDSIDEYCDNVQNALRDSINANVKLSEAIDSLCKEMNLDRTKMHEIVGSEDTIFQLHQKLSTEFNWLLGIKESTCAEMTALRQEEQELIRTMEDIPCLPYDPEKFPTDLDFREINSQLSMLKAEKEIRSRRAAESRLKILHFWDLLGKKPTEAFEKDILSNKMVLSQKNLELLQKLELNLRGKRDDANKELQAKKEEIESLWKRLDYDPLLRESFRKNFGITDCQLAKVK